MYLLISFFKFIKFALQLKVEQLELFERIQDLKGKVHFYSVLIMILNMSATFKYDTNSMSYPIGELMEIFTLLNKVREYSTIEDFFTSVEPKKVNWEQSQEWNFVRSLNRLTRVEKMIDDLRKGFHRRAYTKDLMGYAVVDDGMSKKEIIGDVNREGDEIIKLDLKLQKLSKKLRTRAPKKLILKEKKAIENVIKKKRFLSLVNLERVMIAITTEFTKTEIKQFKEKNPFLLDRNKLETLINVISDLKWEVNTFLRYKNQKRKNMEYQHLILIRPEHEIIQYYRNYGLTISDYEMTYNFLLCPLFVLKGKMYITEPLLELFSLFLKYYYSKEEVLNYKGNHLVMECYDLLSTLQKEGFKIAHNRFPQEEIDIIIYNPTNNKIFLIECTDYAPLYFPFIEETKEEIRKKTKEQLERKKKFIQDKPERLKQIFHQKITSSKIKLIGISRLKCQNYPDIEFFTFLELQKNIRCFVGYNG